MIKKLLLGVMLVFSFQIMFGQNQHVDIVVATDGSGQFATIQAAINSVRDYKAKRTVILIKNGVYHEKLIIPTWKTNITLLGESEDSTIITYGDYASLNNMGTFRTYTCLVQGNGFHAQNLTFENSAGRVGQAVALHVEADCTEIIHCKLLGNQDTLFTGNQNSRQFYKDCYIEGTTDFIFGPATAWFQNCVICSKMNSYVTAASTPENKRYGYVFDHCNLVAKKGVTKVFLGRPWRPYASVIYMNCYLGAQIRPDGWNNWSNIENEKTARFAEYHNNGPGADLQYRVPWSHQLSKIQANKVIIKSVFAGTSVWIPE
ncbi:pectinesterase family protein [Microbacter margulisiae]|uniref:Pectinesterase n=1 Tax=Microbacter margulisiae TaxID=1350067 RepID=A0A7W5DRY5_9PORP|nr:pectinesterase family protein [Microbacter margulisiae]MBB3187977.1 pectin methylesterase-like acyl-CoA thioesterase [Microbacter margulisiae]